MKDPERTGMLERDPSGAWVADAMGRMARKQQLVIAEGLHGGRRRTRPPKRVEEGADRILDPLIRIERDATRGIVDKAHRQWHFELAAASLVHDPSAEPRAQHMQLRLAHRAS